MKMAEEYPGGTPEERQLLEKQIRDRVESLTDVPGDMKKMLSTRVIASLEIVYVRPDSWPSRMSRPNFQIGQIGWKYWAIKNDSLHMVELLSAAAIAITTFAATTTAAPAVLAVTLVFAAIALADRLKKKKTSLTDEQYKLLVTLKGSGPLTTSELAKRLGGLHIFGNDLWSEERTLAALKLLQSVHLGDGTTEALVSQAANGKWATNGI